MSKTITLISSDGQKVPIDETSCGKSKLLVGLLEDFKEDNADIPMPDIKGDVLKKVVEYLENYKDKDPKEIPKPLPSENLVDVTDQWDVDYINSVDLDTTFDIINAANYMDIKPLLDLSCAKIASLMKGKTADEIRTMFNIECDLTEEELKEYEEYQI
jgi:S-phase kinase-associated protein 1